MDINRLPSRALTAKLLLFAVFLLVIVDLIRAEPINPYEAPYPTALGSGQVPSGAHCTDVSNID